MTADGEGAAWACVVAFGSHREPLSRRVKDVSGADRIPPCRAFVAGVSFRLMLHFGGGRCFRCAVGHQSPSRSRTRSRHPVRFRQGCSQQRAYSLSSSTGRCQAERRQRVRASRLGYRGKVSASCRSGNHLMEIPLSTIWIFTSRRGTGIERTSSLCSSLHARSFSMSAAVTMILSIIVHPFKQRYRRRACRRSGSGRTHGLSEWPSAQFLPVAGRADDRQRG